MAESGSPCIALRYKDVTKALKLVARWQRKQYMVTSIDQPGIWDSLVEKRRLPAKQGKKTYGSCLFAMMPDVGPLGTTELQDSDCFGYARKFKPKTCTHAHTKMMHPGDPRCSYQDGGVIALEIDHPRFGTRMIQSDWQVWAVSMLCLTFRCLCQLNSCFSNSWRRS